MQTLRRSGSNFSIRSKFSTHGQSDSWHRQVSLEAGDRHPVGVGYAPDPSFPWAALRQLTDSYLTKNKGRNTGEETCRKFQEKLMGTLLIVGLDVVQSTPVRESSSRR